MSEVSVVSWRWQSVGGGGRESLEREKTIVGVLGALVTRDREDFGGFDGACKLKFNPNNHILTFI